MTFFTGIKKKKKITTPTFSFKYSLNFMGVLTHTKWLFLFNFIH